MDKTEIGSMNKQKTLLKFTAFHNKFEKKSRQLSLDWYCLISFEALA